MAAMKARGDRFGTGKQGGAGGEGRIDPETWAAMSAEEKKAAIAARKAGGGGAAAVGVSHPHTTRNTHSQSIFQILSYQFTLQNSR